MEYKIIKKSSFAVIGKIGSTNEGEGFIKKLYQDLFNSYKEILDKTIYKDSNVLSCWGLMSDFNLDFKPWLNFKQGLYLAGIECFKDIEVSGEWTKWIVPSYEYLVVKVDENFSFNKIIKYIEDNNMTLVGAVFDYTDFTTRTDYNYFPIKKMEVNCDE